MRHARSVFLDGDRSIYDHFQFSPAVRAGPFIYVSGVIGADEQGNAFPDAADEYHATFREIQKLLAVEGASLADIVAMDSFHVTSDFIADVSKFIEVRSQYFEAPHPAWTAVSVVALAIAGARAEVKVTAYLGDQ